MVAMQDIGAREPAPEITRGSLEEEGQHPLADAGVWKLRGAAVDVIPVMDDVRVGHRSIRAVPQHRHEAGQVIRMPDVDVRQDREVPRLDAPKKGAHVPVPAERLGIEVNPEATILEEWPTGLHGCLRAIGFQPDVDDEVRERLHPEALQGVGDEGLRPMGGDADRDVRHAPSTPVAGGPGPRLAGP